MDCKPWKKAAEVIPWSMDSLISDTVQKKTLRTYFEYFFKALILAFQTLAYAKRQGLKRSIDWYKRLLISCLVTRYSPVFVFKSMEINGNPCRSTRSTLQNLICYRTSVSRASGTPCGSVFGRFCVSRFVKLEQLWVKIS